MKKLKRYTYLLGLALLTLTAACTEQGVELTSIDYERLFSPMDLKATVRNQTNVELNWKVTREATSYNVELYANDADMSFQGTPFKTVSDLTAADLPYLVTGLEGETDYSVRVQALAPDKPASKWTAATFLSGAEQLFAPLGDNDVTPFAVTLHWTPGLTATVITLTPGNITHTLTAAELAAGSATVDGLTAETEYTAKLMNGSKTRGTLKFRTLVDIGDATPVNPGDDLAALLAAAADGDAFALFPGIYGTAEKISIKKSVSLKAVRPNDRPVINATLSLEDGASLTLQQVVLDGTGTDSNQAIIFATADATYESLIIEDSEVLHHAKGFFYLNVAATVNEIRINNSLLHAIECDGGDFFDSRKGAILRFTLSNSTVYDLANARDFLRYDDASSSFPGVQPVITLTNNTLVGVANSTSRRILYVRFKNNSITFTGNLVTNTEGYFSNNNNTAQPTFSNNNYFEAPNLLSFATATVTDPAASTLDPGFADAAKGDFTLSNQTLKDNLVGDPRWIK
jgi:hypothetical protein